MRIRIHKLMHWEYWPSHIVYAPTFFLWLYWMLLFRSTKFYKRVNPGITNGGLYGDCKSDIYALLPPNSFPKTAVVDPTRKNNFEELLSKKHFSFPLIVKPDVGLRGIGVKKVHTLDELSLYAKNSTDTFLIQSEITLPNEIGLFYCRLPNQQKGKVTGITIKTFLSITGNGKDTIEQLLKQDPRFEMQIKKLSNRIDLSEVVPLNETRCLVPFGNHNLGTKFTDGKEHITQSLEDTFDKLLSRIPGFYYGRLDIRYNTFEELERGENFAIIEINGAKSEPTHIYDPKHSFLFGQFEILRHQKILKQIIALAPEGY